LARLSVIFASALMSATGTTLAAEHADAQDDKKLIASAMSAAPRAISAHATIVTMSGDGKMRTLRNGTNGWTCMPDDPHTPGDDPMCLDPNAWEWAGAWMSHAAPPDKVGFMYMLKGGSDASNSDPYASEPPPGGHWITTGPHVMIVGPAAKAMAGYIKGADPDTKNAYVMWADTPYEHLMIPVK